MAHLLCINCYQKFDDEKSYSVFEITVSACLTKSGREEVLSLRRPVCPRCGAENDLLNMAEMHTKNRAGMPPRGDVATGTNVSNM